MKSMMSAILALGVTAAASASSVSLTFNGFGHGLTMKLNYAANQGFGAANRSSGSFIATKQHRFSNTGTGQNMRNYCVQVFESVSPGNTYTYNEVNVNDVPDYPPGPGPMGVARGRLMRNLYSRFYSEVDGSTDNVKCAAFALLVWEISHENFNSLGGGATATDILNADALDVGLGAFQVSSVLGLSGDNLAAYNLAQSWIDTMESDANDLRWYGIYGLTNPTAQDHIGVLVPIPAPALLAGLGLVGVVSGRRRSR